MMGFTPLHGRSVDPDAPVDIYRNLNAQKRTGRVVWSVRQRGRVVGHTTEISLTDVLPFVNGIAQQRIAAGAPREVHAFVRGHLAADPMCLAMQLEPVVYRPHVAPWFFYVQRPDEVWQGADFVMFTEKGMFAR